MSIRIFLFLFCASLAAAFMMGCTQDGDGPMDAWDSGVVYQGQGFYLEGILDSGRRVHARTDSLSVELDSLWLISRCYLRHVDYFESNQDSQTFLAFRLWLQTDPASECPSSPLGGDTLVVIPPSAAWKNSSLLFLRGAIDSVAIDEDSVPRRSPLSDAERFGSNVDSIWILDGMNQDSVFFFTFDSNFSNRKKLPRKVGKGPWVVRFLHPPQYGMNFWVISPEKCKASRSRCTLVPDTLWPTLAFNDTAAESAVYDTNLVSLRQRCKGDSTALEYCAARDWVRDSSKALSYGQAPDTMWSWSTFFVERIPQCAVLNRDTLHSYLSSEGGGSARFWRELFIPALPQAGCGIPWTKVVDSVAIPIEFGGTLLEDWLVYSLDAQAIVIDTSLADSVVRVIQP